MKTLVYARTTDPHRQAEALRAALGVTLRGAEVEVVLDAPPATPLAQRAATTLASFGHTVGAPLDEALARADVVEVWTDPATSTDADVGAGVSVRASSPAAGRRRTLHLVRTALPAGVVADGDEVVYLEGVDHDLLLPRIFAADRVITW